MSTCVRVAVVVVKTRPPLANATPRRPERELTFVPKKGRPITQCPHCRAERKKRSAHVKCDCGDRPPPKEKCVHLRDAEAKAAVAAATEAATAGTSPSGSSTPESMDKHTPHFDLVPLPEESPWDDNHCCCGHGGQCTCATMKRESSDDGHDSVPKTVPNRPKPRLTSHQSEGHLTIFANGHHKPVHRNNNAAHECGVPYKLPRSHASERIVSIARRSVDSLASVQSVSPVTWRHPSAAVKAVSPPYEQVPLPSEQASPPIDFTLGQHQSFDTAMSMDTTPYSAPEPSSIAASAPIPNTLYQNFGFPSTTSALSIATTSTEPSMPAYSMPPSALDFDSGATDFWANVDWSRLGTNKVDTQPALTNASSGTISEIDDLPRVDDLSAFEPQYPVNGQMQPFDYNNDFSDSTYGANFSLNSHSSTSNRWSMPAFSSQGTNAAFPAPAADSKEMSGQSYGLAQPALPSQMAGGDSSAQSHSPTADAFFQNKPGDVSSFNWDALIPDYGTGVVPSTDGSIFALSESGQNAVAAQQANSASLDVGSFDSFDHGYRTMQWNDGVPIRAEQDYVNNFNFDSNWPAGSFDPWS